MSYRKHSKKVARIRIEGPDKKGIIATNTNFLSENQCNIEDIDQRILEGYLIMNMVVDYTDSPVPLNEFIDQLKKTAASVGTTATFKTEDKKAIKHIALLVTKEPHCLIDILETLKKGKLKGRVVVIIGNHPDLKSMAFQYKIPFHFVSAENKKIHEQKVLDLLKDYDVDLIVLARYMQILSPEFVFRHEGRIINIHPSLLPAFPGPRSYHQAFNKGVEIVGVTAHFVTTDLDEGPIITQDCFKVDKSKDTIEKIIAKGRILEAKVLTRAVGLFLEDRLCLRRGKVLHSKEINALVQRTKQFYQ